MVTAENNVDIVTVCTANSTSPLHSADNRAVLTAVGVDDEINTACAVMPVNPNIFISKNAAAGPPISLQNAAIYGSFILKFIRVFDN